MGKLLGGQEKGGLGGLGGCHFFYKGFGVVNILDGLSYLHGAMVDPLVHSFLFVVFATGIVIFLLLFLGERFHCFKVLALLPVMFGEVVVMYA